MNDKKKKNYEKIYLIVFLLDTFIIFAKKIAEIKQVVINLFK